MFEKQQVDILLRRLKEDHEIKASAPEAIVHALVDIGVSMERICGDLIPRLVQGDSGLQGEPALETWWNMDEGMLFHDREGALLSPLATPPT